MFTHSVSHFGTNPILIASKGIIVNPQDIVGHISIRYEVSNKFKIIRDETALTSNDISVIRNVEVDAIATIFLNLSPNELMATSAEAFNASNREGAIKQMLAESNIPAASAKEEKVSRRGRRRKEEEDETEVKVHTEEEINQRILTTAVDIIVDRTIIEDANPISLRASAPFKALSDLSEKNQLALSNNLARLRKAVSIRGDSAQNLRSGAGIGESLDEVANDLVPALSKDLRTIDEAGLKNYESRLQDEVEKAEQTIHDIYDFFEEKVVNRYNREAAIKKGPFVEQEINVVGNIISRKDVIEKLFKEELISIPFGTPSKTK